MGIEPTLLAWKAKVLPLNYTRINMQVWWRELDSNQRRRSPADLQSAPIGRSGIPPYNIHQLKITITLYKSSMGCILLNHANNVNSK